MHCILDTHSKDKLVRHTEHNTCPSHCNVVQACDLPGLYTSISVIPWLPSDMHKRSLYRHGSVFWQEERVNGHVPVFKRKRSRTVVTTLVLFCHSSQSISCRPAPLRETRQHRCAHRVSVVESHPHQTTLGPFDQTNQSRYCRPAPLREP